MSIARPNPSRVLALLRKEFVQMRRDRLTLGMMVGIPIIQLLLFGFAINTDPRHMPTLVEMHDDGPATRAVIEAMRASQYFAIEELVDSPQDADAALRRGEALFVLSVPENFERDLARGERPQLFLDADATDPVAASAAAGAFPQIVASALRSQTGMTATPPAIETIVHRRYNPAGRTAVNIVPGLLGVILTMTLAMMTSMALTREAERGTLETLLATPLLPAEVMFGKIAPYVAVGFMQTVLMLAAARFLFAVPFFGQPPAFLAALALFIFVNLSMGFLFSTLAKTQMQAMQMTFFFFLPSILLSGFMFPFAGMPGWARTLGNALPNTHFIRAVRAVMLKDAGFIDIWPQLAALLVMCVVIATLAITRYRRTLD